MTALADYRVQPCDPNSLKQGDLLRVAVTTLSADANPLQLEIGDTLALSGRDMQSDIHVLLCGRAAGSLRLCIFGEDISKLVRFDPR